MGALTSGGALLAFLTTIWGPYCGSEEHRRLVTLLGRIVLVLLAADVLLEWAEVSIGLWSAFQAQSAALKLVLFGNFWWVFRFVHLSMGVVIPGLLLVFKPRSIPAVGLAGALIAFSFITVRLNIVIPALALPELEGLKHAFTGPGLSFDYFPSAVEWLLFILTVVVAGLIFMVGKRALPVIDTVPIRRPETEGELIANLKEA